MATVIQHQEPQPQSGNAFVDYLAGLLKSMLTALTGLLTLDAGVRAQRTVNAERGVLFGGATVVAAAVTSFEVLFPDVITKDFTTALIVFDTASGAGRFRYDGGFPVSAAATATAGLPIPAGGFTFRLTGALNIRSFRVIGEPAATLNMSVMLHQ